MSLLCVSYALMLPTVLLQRYGGAKNTNQHRIMIKNLSQIFTQIQEMILSLLGISTKTYITCNGRKVSVNISRRALGRYTTSEGCTLKHNMRVMIGGNCSMLHKARPATIIGVTVEMVRDYLQEVVWCQVDGDAWKISYFTDDVSFSLPPEET